MCSVFKVLTKFAVILISDSHSIPLRALLVALMRSWRALITAFAALALPYVLLQTAANPLDGPEVHDFLHSYGYSGSFVSDDPLDAYRTKVDMAVGESKDEVSSPRATWPGNKVYIPSKDVSFETRPADFGRVDVDKDGLWGTMEPIRSYMVSSKVDVPNTGCIPSDRMTGNNLQTSWGTWLKRVVHKRPPPNWIALVERGECTFEEKVRVAQSLGAVAVVVGDAKSMHDRDDFNYHEMPLDENDGFSGERPIAMKPTGDTSDIVIPSCFVIRSSYEDLLHWSENGVRAALYLDRLAQDHFFDMGMILLLLPSILTVGAVLSHHARICIRRFWERASVRSVHALPCYIWHGDRAWERDLSERKDTNKSFVLNLWVTFYSSIRIIYEKMVPSIHLDECEPLVPGLSRTREDNEDPVPHSRWFVMEECPICLLNFQEGCVMKNEKH